MDVGAALRDAREQRGISLDELSRTTKISPTTLRAIESNQIDKLPGGIFTRGFLRAYADHVGLDGEETVQRYLAQFEARAGAVAVTDRDAASPSARLARRDADAGDSSPHGVSVRLVLAGLTLALGVAGYVALRGSRTPGAQAQNTVPSQKTAERSIDQSPPASASPPASGAVTPAIAAAPATPAIQEGNAPVSQTQNAVRLDIRTQKSLWISATADGTSVAYQLMQAGERREIDARDEIVLRVGDAGAFTYVINDLPGRSLGRAGQPVTVRITPQNVREFVVP